MLPGWNKNIVCFDTANMNALCDNSDHRSRIMQPQLGLTTITGLHVNEGEGIETAVSNRMSLYEQLTVSSHRFAKISDHCRPSATSSSVEHSMFKSNQHTPSSLHLSFLPPSDKRESLMCPFFGTIEGFVACASKSHDASRRQPGTASETLLKTTAVAATSENLDCKSNDAARRQPATASETLLKTTAVAAIIENLDFTTLKKSSEFLVSPAPNTANEHKNVDTSGVSSQDIPCADLMMLVKGAQCLRIGDSLHVASACKEDALSPHSEGCTGSDSKKVLTFDLAPNALTQNNSHGGHNAKQVEIFGMGHTPQPQGTAMLLDGLVDAQKGEGCCSERCMITKAGVHDAALQGATANDELQESEHMCRKVYLELVPPDHDAKVSKRAQESGLPILDEVVGETTANAAVRIDCRACQDSAIRGSWKCKIAETFSNDIQMENDTDDAEAEYTSPISPKSMIQALGQLRFWKTRLALIRQQKVFSDQVFELHKLIEVQRLIAGTPNVPINEMYFGVGNMVADCDSDGSLCGFVDKEEVTIGALGKEVSASKEVASAPLIVRDTNSKLCDGQSKCPSNTAIAENEGVPWPTRGPTQTGICPYLPFIPGFTPGPAVGGPFAAAIRGHGARPQRATCVQSSYGFKVASSHQQQCQLRISCSSSNFEPRTYDKEVPCGRKSLEVLESQADDYQRMSMGFKLKASIARPRYDRHQCLEYNERDSMQAGDMPQESNAETMGSFSGWKRQKETKQQDQPVEVARGQEVDEFYLLNPSMRALNLSPFAPILTSHCDRRGFSGGKQWQGHALKVVPRAANSASESADDILVSIQKERKPV